MVSLRSSFPGSSIGDIQDDDILHVGPTVPVGGGGGPCISL